MTDKLAALLALCERARQFEIDHPFRSRLSDEKREFLLACLPEVVAALVKMAIVLRETHSNYRSHDGCEECAALRALDAALGDKS